MRESHTILALLLIFALVQVLGLYAGYQYLQLIESGEIQGAFADPESVYNSVLLFIYILAITAAIIIVIKFKKSLLKAFEALAVFIGSWIMFDFLVPYSAIGYAVPVGLILALALTLWKMLKPTILSQNIALIFAVSGAGAVIGGSLGVFPVLVFIMILSFYDFFSVFVSKHMVYMAKAITETPMAFTAAVPSVGKKKRKHTFQLGGGDLVMPLILSVAVLGRLTMAHAALTALGGFVALWLLFSYVVKHPGEALPALPPIGAGACAGMFLSVMLFGA